MTEPYDNLLKDAAFEITVLRNENRIMKARLDMFDMIMTTLHTEPARQSQGFSPDVLAAINKHLEQQARETAN